MRMIDLKKFIMENEKIFANEVKQLVILKNEKVQVYLKQLKKGKDVRYKIFNYAFYLFIRFTGLTWIIQKVNGLGVKVRPEHLPDCFDD